MPYLINPPRCFPLSLSSDRHLIHAGALNVHVSVSETSPQRRVASRICPVEDSNRDWLYSIDLRSIPNFTPDTCPVSERACIIFDKPAQARLNMWHRGYLVCAVVLDAHAATIPVDEMPCITDEEVYGCLVELAA